MNGVDAMGRVGIKLQNGLPISVNVALAQYAENRGLSSVWVSETRARDAFTTMAVYAAATERVVVGSAIVPIYTRSPVTLAMTAASLEEIAPGRIILGLGTSSSAIVEGWHGCRRHRPLLAMDEHVAAIRAILGGERVSIAGQTLHVDGFRLEFPRLAAPTLPLYVAALGSRMLSLAGAIADGVLLNLVPVSHIARFRKTVAGAALATGRSVDSVRLAGDLRVGTAGDPGEIQQIRERQRKYIAHYGNVDVYNRFFTEVGFSGEAEELMKAWATGDSARALHAVSDEMLDQMVAIGDPAAVVTRISAYLDAGLDEVILYPCWNREEDAQAATQQAIELAAEICEHL